MLRYQYFSCGNSQCPQCQGIKRLQWQDRLAVRMLNVPYVHVTFTLPHELNGLARRNPEAIYNLLLRSSWKTIFKVCADEKNMGGTPGMTAVLHTWGSDLKYHIHAHCLVTFGGLTEGQNPQWKWPKRKHKLARFRKMCSTYRETFLSGLKGLMACGEVVYHESFEDIEAALLKKRWVVNNTRPTADTKVIEEYLGRYICRIGISNKRLSYDKNGKNVCIEYNDYRNQKQGQAAPKKYRDLPPLVAMQMLLQHQLPPYFQKVRHYGLHSAVSYQKIKDQIPDQLKRNGRTVRTVIQILKVLLATKPYECEHCGGTDFEIDPIQSDGTYLVRHILHKERGPPSGQADTTANLVMLYPKAMKPCTAMSKNNEIASKM